MCARPCVRVCIRAFVRVRGGGGVYVKECCDGNVYTFLLCTVFVPQALRDNFIKYIINKYTCMKYV